MKQLVIAFIFMTILMFLGFIIGCIFYIVGNLIRHSNLNFENLKEIFYNPIVLIWTIIGLLSGIALFIGEVKHFIRSK